MDIINYIKELGWVYVDNFSNREVYELGKDSICDYYLFEHSGEIGILYDGKFNYYNLNQDDISMFTKLLKQEINMIDNPKDYTLYESLQNADRIQHLIKKFSKRC